MILLDANLLIYAHNPDAEQHHEAREWLEDLLAGSETVGLSWMTLWAFIRIITNRRVNPHLQSSTEVFHAVRAILRHPLVRIVEPGPNHLETLEQMATKGQALSAMLTDAALAALAIGHGATLASTDHDFSRFPGLKWINPLMK